MNVYTVTYHERECGPSYSFYPYSFYPTLQSAWKTETKTVYALGESIQEAIANIGAVDIKVKGVDFMFEVVMPRPKPPPEPEKCKTCGRVK